MAGRNPVTQIIITAKDEASAIFTGLRNHAGKIATAIGAYFTGRLFGDIVGSSREFEAAMSAVQAASGASAGELAVLRAAAEQAGARTKYTSVEAAGALETLAKAGLSASDAVAALPAVLDLASAGGVGLGEASEFISKAVAGMGLSFSEAGRVADVLAMGANASNTSVVGLAQALSYSAPLANSLGLSLEQTVAIIGKFADAGIDASRAGTALNSILAQFSNPTSKFRQELAAAGITTSNFDQALRELAAAGPAGQKAIIAVGQEAGPALRALLNQGIESLDALKARLDDSAGSARSFAEVMSDNLDGAAKGFGSAWDALLIKLGTPVLETLKSQVNAISSRLREFVANGTAERFGEAIKRAFEAGGRWAADFFARVDFTKLAADMQGFATRAGELFDWIGQRARIAGNLAQATYGVMSAGLNSVLSVIYKVGQGTSWLASALLSDLAVISDGIAKITFGDLSKGFADAAESMRQEARAAYAVSDEFGEKAAEAFDEATAGATRAQEAWFALSTQSASSSASISSDLQTVQEQSQLTADQLDSIGESGQYIAGAVTQAADAAQQSSVSQQNAAEAAQKKVAELKSEYERLIAVGDTQGAANALVDLRQQLSDTGKEAKASADDVAAAFERMGVISEAELKRAASNARRDFETIRTSGMASAYDIERAFAAYAEKAISANNGVVPATLRSEAAIHRVRIEADETGRAIVRAMSEGGAALDALGAKADAAAAKVGMIKRQADGLSGVWDADGNLIDRGKGGSATVKRMDNGQEAILSRAERLGGLSLRKEIEREWQRWADSRGPGGMAGMDPKYAKLLQGTIKKLDEIQIEQEQTSGKFAANQPRIASEVPATSSTTYRVEIGIGGGRSKTINTADQTSANALVDVLRQLEEAAARS